VRAFSVAAAWRAPERRGWIACPFASLAEGSPRVWTRCRHAVASAAATGQAVLHCVPEAMGGRSRCAVWADGLQVIPLINLNLRVSRAARARIWNVSAGCCQRNRLQQLGSRVASATCCCESPSHIQPACEQPAGQASKPATLPNLSLHSPQVRQRVARCCPLLLREIIVNTFLKWCVKA
jgi:hypothetical protein